MMNIRTFHSIWLLPLGVLLFCREATPPEASLSRAVVEAHINYLASDELQGRDTGTPGGDLAAVYIAGQYQACGLEMLPGMSSYLQPVPLEKVAIPVSAELAIDGQVFAQGTDLLLLDGPELEKNTTMVYAGYGWVDKENGHDDYKGLDVAGKIVLTIPGTPAESGVRAAFGTLTDKQKIAVERGALGVLQLYSVQFPWNMLARRYESARLQLAEADGVPPGFSAWLKELPEEKFQKLREGGELPVVLKSSGSTREAVRANNVAGQIRGSDPQLREEYLLLTAHYDHVGIGRPDQRQDSIYNGARDNAMGVAALLAAAEALAKQPPRRSVIFLAVTAEEKGLLGSRYYADAPLIPLRQTIYNLNSDGGGYNDTTAVAVIGYGRTGTDEAVAAAVQLAGLEKYIPNPEPRQNFFDRSDNVSFAAKGVPCLTISPGFSEFDERIQQYYHRPADEAATLDFDYVLRFCKAFAHAARLIADNPVRPQWAAGDKYEAIGKKLYGQD